MTARLRHYVCGSTAHDVGAMFRGASRGVREFPSGVFLYDARDGRRVLFDTGYATGIWNTGWRGAVYRRLLPPTVSDADDVAVRLASDGVDPASVTHVVLSHLHPDHVGGVRRFPDAEFVLSAGQERTLAAPRLREGVLTGLLPEWFATAEKTVLDDPQLREVLVGGVTLHAHDLLGDGSYLVVDLPGHADGHLGALVEHSVLLAGDAAWGSDLIDASSRLRALPRAIQHDADRYSATATMLGHLAAAGIRVVCSHDPLGGKDLLG
ncbi:MBL fold metallo-hydrolase [Microbacterium sp. ISL-103]|uniref:MBL fold metallo-hydrolase n=1 Tax=Microbacterium sp. ISL-103 TaxID=2819156 RepID=UPI001BEA06A1|nr:MBL fold metallo-hydrolase [Microbacterium sp. ISL-103]MBT2476091.1 MBL fold metallo-hydrolase [Microbacterium sp. ISL-103]